MSVLAPDYTTTTVLDAVARICALAIGIDDPDNHVFAAGVTDEVINLEPQIVPLADDFTEAGTPLVTVALGPWKPLLAAHRAHLTLLGAIWRPRVPLGENTLALYADHDALEMAFKLHSKAFLHEDALQSAVLMGGPGIRPRSVPRTTSTEAMRLFLTLPFTVDVSLNVATRPEAA